MVCCGIVGRGACIQSLLFSVLLVLVFPFLSSREFSGPTSQGENKQASEKINSFPSLKLSKHEIV